MMKKYCLSRLGENRRMNKEDALFYTALESVLMKTFYSTALCMQ